MPYTGSATIQFFKGDGITSQVNPASPGSSQFRVRLHIVGATDISDARACLADYTLPAGTLEVITYPPPTYAAETTDLSACFKPAGGEITFAGFQDCTNRVYEASVIYENTKTALSDL